MRSVEVAQLLLTSRHKGTLHQPKYTFDVVLCATSLLDDIHLHEVISNAGLPWVLVGDASDAMVGTNNVYHVASLLRQTYLKDTLLTLFQRSGTDVRAPLDKADPSPDESRSFHIKPSNAHPDNYPQFAEMTVLSVDDVPMNQCIVQAFLERLGAHVDLVSNGRKVCILLPLCPSCQPVQMVHMVFPLCQDLMQLHKHENVK